MTGLHGTEHSMEEKVLCVAYVVLHLDYLCMMVRFLLEVTYNQKHAQNEEDQMVSGKKRGFDTPNFPKVGLPRFTNPTPKDLVA